jgi:hypothetical protein
MEQDHHQDRDIDQELEPVQEPVPEQEWEEVVGRGQRQHQGRGTGAKRVDQVILEKNHQEHAREQASLLNQTTLQCLG